MPRGSQEATPHALIHAQVGLESFCLAPDGSALVYVLRRVRHDDYESHIWWRPLHGGRPRQLTRGRVRDGSPAISPDGGSVAFVRSQVGATDSPGQAWILPIDGGEAWQTKPLKHGVISAHWGPTGDRLALVAPGGDPRFIVGDERKGQAPRVRRITRLDYRDDESGHVDRRWHLWLVAARPGAVPRPLTKGDFDVLNPAWSPDGKRIAFASDIGPDANIHPRSQIWSVGTDAARPRVRELVSLRGDAERPSFSPDGKHLAFIGTDQEDPSDAAAAELWVVNLPSGAPRSLTRELDRPVGDWAWNDLLVASDAPGPIWLDNAGIAVIVGTNGRGIPHRVTLDGAVEPIADAGLRMASCAIDAAGGRIAIAAAIDGGAGDVWAIDDGAPRRLTEEGSAWIRRFPTVEIEELRFDGPAGPIQAWLASPRGAGRGSMPTVLHLHGGPTGSWGPGGTLDEIALCAAGYRVLMPNIRGSATFGSAWVEALSGRWGNVDAADALAAVDGLVALGLADPDRLAVMGLSYGGFLTNWLIGVTDRFKAACSENGVANQVSAWGNSYFGVHYNRHAGLGDPLSDRGAQRLWRGSPLRNAAAIHTPLLILQSEEDRICPPADAEQLFTALKVLDREVEYLLYPEEHHEMKNYGRPDRRIDRQERILGWFDRHVRGT